MTKRKNFKDRRKNNYGPWPLEERRKEIRRKENVVCKGCPQTTYLIFHEFDCPVSRRFD